MKSSNRQGTSTRGIQELRPRSNASRRNIKHYQTLQAKANEVMAQGAEILGGADKNVPAAVTLGLQAYAHKTLVVGQRGHELQMALDEDDLATVAHWLRHAANRTRAVYEE